MNGWEEVTSNNQGTGMKGWESESLITKLAPLSYSFNFFGALVPTTVKDNVYFME